MTDDNHPTPNPAPNGTPTAREAVPPESGAVRPRRRRVRRMLLWGGPLLVVLVGAFFYFTSGRYVGTDNAYVKADKVAVSPRVEGTITAVDVAENQSVRKDQVLFQIDPTPFRIALQQAQAQLDSARADLLALQAQYRQSQDQLRLAESNLGYAERELRRQTGLDKRKLTSQAAVDQARHARDQASQQVQVTREQMAQLQAQLGGDASAPITEHPRYRQALAAKQQAELDLQHTTVKAPFAGVASNTPEPGAYVKPGTPVMSIVASGDIWVEANFKETDLTHVHPGQPVTIKVDTYPGQEWQGRVASLSQATGAEFSVLPPQNATGNWVKVVQRIPVRISLPAGQHQQILRAGMSTNVEIDTGHYRALPGFARAALDRLGILPAHAADAPAGNS